MSAYTDLESVLGVAVIGDYVYWTDRASSRYSLGRAPKRGGGAREVVLEDSLGLQGLWAVNTSASLGE